jgi:hypothetical protein
MEALSRPRAQSLIMGGTALGALYVVAFAIVQSAAFAHAPERMALGITVDLTVTAAVIVWWFGARRNALPGWVAVATFAWGFAIARAWVPHAPTHMLVTMGGLTEAVMIGWLMLRIARVVRTARAARDQGPIGSIETGLRTARIPAPVAGVLAGEIAVVVLALTGWFRRPEPGAMSMRSTGWMIVPWLLGFLLVGETVASHLLLASWSPVAAWIATAGSAYLVLWVIADAQAIRLHPVAVSGQVLHVRLGVRWRATIPLTEIVSVTEIATVPEGALNLALFEPTVLVTLRAPVAVRGLFGKRRLADRLALTIDDPEAFAVAAGARPSADARTLSARAS